MIDYVFFFIYMLYFNLVMFLLLKDYTTMLTSRDYFKFANNLNVKTNLTMIMLFIIYQFFKNI